MDIFQQVLISAFLIALVVGFVANKTSFCTMGAVSDWINIGDTGRMRSWVFAIGMAILGVGILESFNAVDMSLVASGSTGKPPYTHPQFIWLRYILGGLLFGLGMVLGSGCGNKTLVRIGGGNIKSVIVFLAMGGGAYLMIYTDFGEIVFLQWMRPLSITFSDYGIQSQSLSDIVASTAGWDSKNLPILLALILGGLAFAWAFKSEDFRSHLDNVLGGVVVGVGIVAAWYVTAGEMGQTLLEEADFMDQRPYDIGAQSFTFVKPSAQFLYFMQEGFAPHIFSFALAAAGGIIAGSFVYALFARNFRIEWFASIADGIRHIVGGVLMGVGGVLSLGCTFGQAITGASTLALGSFVTFAFIIIGAALTMKTQYYKMVYEDEASWGAALAAGMADMYLLPSRWRKLEKV